MSKILFSNLNLTPKISEAVSKMGYDYATPIQSEAIPLIRTGVDVIAKSQTGTGKTVAFSIPAIEKIDTHEEKTTIQVLILCPTRELAQQANDEMKKLSRFKSGIHSVAIYGGAPIGRQCIQLRRANIVIGTPGRVMDHMRRRTIRLENLKMIILDEADEMLNMGFKEDIETILKDTPDTRQTLLFSATMPPAIVKLAKQFQNNAQTIEINKDEKVIANIDQSYIDVPRSKKSDLLKLLLNLYKPKRTIIFCNTKKMTDVLTQRLKEDGYSAKSLHGDIRQAHRTTIMRAFKFGEISILVATDVAARGIDVNDIDYVINYDIPQNTEYYIHRIGRTGRAGKSGCSITICSGRSEIFEMKRIANATNSEIKELILPTNQDITENNKSKLQDKMEKLLESGTNFESEEIILNLAKKGYAIEEIAKAALCLADGKNGVQNVEQFKVKKIGNIMGKKGKIDYMKDKDPRSYSKIVINIGRKKRVAPNQIVGALTESTNLTGSDIGKITVTDEKSVVDVPKERVDEVIDAMKGCKIRGHNTKTTNYTD